MDHGPEDAYEAATYDRRKELTEPKVYTIPGEEPPAEVQFLVSNNGNWTISRDNEYWVLEHSGRGIIDAGPVHWDDLKIAIHGKFCDMSKVTYERPKVATWRPEDGPPPERITTMQLLEQDIWWKPKEKPPLRIEDMEQGHIQNLHAFLLRRAPQLKLRYEMRMFSGPQPSGDAACDAFDDGMSELWRQSPEDWILLYPLMKKLAQLVEAFA
jgi:hypothetical protein